MTPLPCRAELLLFYCKVVYLFYSLRLSIYNFSMVAWSILKYVTWIGISFLEYI